MTENPAKFFDDILKFLSSDYHRIFKLGEIHEHLYPEDFDYSDDLPDNFSELVTENKNSENIKNALMFLNKQGLIAANFNTDEYVINTAGFVKIKTRGFEGEIKREKTNNMLQRATWIVLPIAGFITALCTAINLYLSYFCKAE